MNGLDQPLWLRVQREEPQWRADGVRNLNDLLKEREELDTMIDHIRGVLSHKPRTVQTASVPGAPNWQASLAGFHNPKKHAGWTYSQFLDAYLKRMYQRKDKRKTFLYVDTHREELRAFISTHFNNTLIPDRTLPVVVEQTRR